MKAKYINPFTDFGFKKIFGEEASKPLLLDFLNSLLPVENTILNLSFKNTEQLGQTEMDRKAIYDIYCEAASGEKFIVELQKAKQNYFKDRTIYYSTFPKKNSIRFPSLSGEGGRRPDEVEQAEKGEWNYNLKAVFCIGILDFTFDDYENEREENQVVHTIKLKNQKGKIFYDKLTYIYLEMPNFEKHENELNSRLDKWLYFIKYLEDFQKIPQIFKGEIVFEKAFEKAELAKLNTAEQDQYEYSLKVFRDLKNTYDYAVQTAREEGLQQGLEQGLQQGKEEGLQQGILKAKMEVALSLKQAGVAIAVIITTTGLTEEEIMQL